MAAFFCLRQIVWVGEYGQPGGPFRYLTNWSLLLSFFAASRMLAFTEHRSKDTWPNLVAVAAIVNLMMVYLYWSMRLRDPGMIDTGLRHPIWADYYLHLLGPLLLWFDALFIRRAFEAFRSAALWLMVTASVYLCWIELFVARFNGRPQGLVTSGLPYPFLNDMVLVERLVFYGTRIAGAVLLLWILCRVMRGVARYPASASSSARSPER